MLRHLLIFFGLLTLSACNWVAVTEAGETVRIATTAEIGECERLGRTNTQVRDRVGFVDRSVENVQEELTGLARNEAAEMGANTIVAESVISGGRQTFGVYRCP